MGARDRVKMSSDEVAAFLAEELKVQIATVDRDGAPHLVTMFYVLVDGKIAFTTYRTSQKVRNLERNPVMTCLVEGGSELDPQGAVAYGQLRGVTVRGKARIVTDPEEVVRIGAQVAARMSGLAEPPADPAFAEGVRAMMAKRVAVILEPDTVASWDHRKLAH